MSIIVPISYTDTFELILSGVHCRIYLYTQKINCSHNNLKLQRRTRVYLEKYRCFTDRLIVIPCSSLPFVLVTMVFAALVSQATNADNVVDIASIIIISITNLSFSFNIINMILHLMGLFEYSMCSNIISIYYFSCAVNFFSSYDCFFNISTKYCNRYDVVIFYYIRKYDWMNKSMKEWMGFKAHVCQTGQRIPPEVGEMHQMTECVVLLFYQQHLLRYLPSILVHFI